MSNSVLKYNIKSNINIDCIIIYVEKLIQEIIVILLMKTKSYLNELRIN